MSSLRFTSFLVLVLLGTAELAFTQEKRQGISVERIVIAGVNNAGVIDRYDDKMFWITLEKTGEQIGVSWTTLAEAERKRIWKLLGEPATGPRKKSLDGLEPESMPRLPVVVIDREYPTSTSVPILRAQAQVRRCCSIAWQCRMTVVT